MEFSMCFKIIANEKMEIQKLGQNFRNLNSIFENGWLHYRLETYVISVYSNEVVLMRKQVGKYFKEL